MPDLRLPSSLAVVQDQRSSAHNMGIGDANTSGIGAFFEGAVKGASAVTDIRAKQLETKRLNDPERLATEQLKRELDAEKLLEEITKERISNRYLEREKQEDLRASEARRGYIGALAGESRERTRRSAKYGDLLDQSQLISRAASAKANDATAEAQEIKNAIDKLLGAEKVKASIAKDRAQESYYRAGALERASKVDLEDEVAGKLSDREKANIRQIEGRRAYLYDLREAATKNRATTPEQLAEIDDQIRRFDELNPPAFRYETEEGEIRGGTVLSAPAKKDAETGQPVITPAQQARNRILTAQAQLLDDLQQLDVKESEYEIAQRRREAQTRLLEIERQGSKLSRTNSENLPKVLTKKLSELRDLVDAEGPDTAAAVQKIAELDAAYRMEDDPVQKQVIGGVLADAMGLIGGAELAIDYIETDPTIPAEQKKELKKLMYGAAIRSGDTNSITGFQKDLLDLGLDEEALSDPEGTVQSAIKLLQGNDTEVDSRELKRLQGHPYFSRVAEVSNDGRQGFTIRRRPLPNNNSEPVADMAGGEGQNSATHEVLEFRSLDGSKVLYGPVPQSDEDWAYHSLLKHVSKEMSGAQARAATTRQQMQQIAPPANTQNQQRPAANPNTQSPPPTEDPAAVRERTIEKGTRKLLRMKADQYVKQNGKQPSREWLRLQEQQLREYVRKQVPGGG